MAKSLHNTLNKRFSDFCGLPFTETVTAAEHLRAWFTDDRRKLISARAVDIMANRPPGTLSRFLAGEKYMTFERADVSQYYPVLRLVGYSPPNSSRKRQSAG